MFSILRPFLFNLNPETAHDLAIKSLKFNFLPSKVFKVEDEKILQLEDKGIHGTWFIKKGLWDKKRSRG